MLFCKATEEICRSTVDLLHVYKNSYDQKINIDKSSVFFGLNNLEVVKDSIKGILGVQAFLTHEKYLGLPSLIGKSKRQILSSLNDRVDAKKKKWKEKLLSRGGWEVLLKSMAQAILSLCDVVFQNPSL